MKEPKALKSLVVGYGPLGKRLCENLKTDYRFNLEAIIDNDPSKNGLQFAGLTIENDLKKILEQIEFDIAFITTSSKIEKIKPLLELIATYKIDIVSSCEELTYPWQSHAELASQIDELAKTDGIRILGTGINPGYLMDYLVLVLSKAFLRLNKVFYQRFINTDHRRESFQKKVGVGLTLAEFEKTKGSDLFGHVGLRQSVDMLAASFNWHMKKYDEKISPIDNDGLIMGIEQTALAKFTDGKSIELIFKAQKGIDDKDRIVLDFDDQDVPVLFEIPNGINGETGTVAVLMNTACKLDRLKPGLSTMKDL